MPAHTRTMAAATSSTMLRRPKDVVRTLPSTVNALLCLMLRRFRKRAEEVPTISNGLFLDSRFFPQTKLLGLVDVPERLALAAQPGLSRRKPPAESLARHTQRIFRVHLQAARQRNDGEQHVANLLERALPVSHARKVARLLRDRLGGPEGRGEIKPYPGGALLQTERPRERGHRRGHPVDQRFLAARLASLVHLLVLPVAPQLVRIRHGNVPEPLRSS